MSEIHTSKEDIIREQIIRTAQQLFQRYGPHKVTMEDVAEAVGKAKSSLYYYYKSKEEIWDAVMDIEITEIMTAIERAVEQVEGVEQKIHAFCGTMLKALRNKRVLYNITQSDNPPPRRDKSASAMRSRFVKRESLVFNQILADGISRGELRPMDKKDQDVLVFVLLSGLKNLEKERVPDEDDYDLEPAINMLTHMVIHGLKP